MTLAVPEDAGVHNWFKTASMLPPDEFQLRYSPRPTMSTSGEESNHVYEGGNYDSFSSSPAGGNEEASYEALQDKKKKKVYDVESRNLTVADVQKWRRAELEQAEQVMLILGLDMPEIALDLLRRYKWMPQQLEARYPRRPVSIPTLSAAPSPSCSICGPDLSPTIVMAHLQCGHRFCTSCWVRYLEAKIMGRGLCGIRCMQVECKWLTPGSFIKKLCGDEVYNRFEVLSLYQYVEGLPYLKFCPAPDCPDIISCPAAASKLALKTIVPTVTCSNGHTFCFGCHIDSDHRPILCRLARLWLDRCRKEAEIQPQLTRRQEHIATINWINTNTKECPGCHIHIEKNGGCNHMTCNKCRNEFCWLCLSAWAGHSCNSYGGSNTRQQPNALPESSALPPELGSFLHYFHRWKNHEQSAMLSSRLLAKTESNMEEMQRTGKVRWIDVQFMKKAVENVLQCRRTLQWTYVMAYYLEDDTSKELFECHQRDLEKVVEDFTELLESRIRPDTIFEHLSKLKNQAVHVQTRNEKMLEATADGFKQGRWIWSELRLASSGGQNPETEGPGHDPMELVRGSSSHPTDPAAHIVINAPRSLYIRLVELLTCFFLSLLARVRRIGPF